MSSLNWGDLVKDAGASGSFEPIPDGDYELKVIEASHTKTSSGKTMFKTTSEITVGPYSKRRIWDNIVLTPDSAGALGFFFRKMAALGLETSYFETSPTNEAIVAALRGRVFRASIKKSTYNGKDGNEIDKYLSATATSPTFAPTAPAAAPAPAPAAAAPAPAAPAQVAPAPAASAPVESPWVPTAAPAVAATTAPPAPF